METHATVLVVDDSEFNLNLVKKILADEGYDITIATSGEEALEFALEQHFDLILLDIMMPGMDGFEVCQQLKKDKLFDTPIIFLSAKGEVDDIVEGFKMGGVDYIAKPFRNEELIMRVRNHVQLKLARDLIKQYSETYKDSRNNMLSMFLKLGRDMAQ
jgi:DNA-binding response OmpR family regulator